MHHSEIDVETGPTILTTLVRTAFLFIFYLHSVVEFGYLKQAWNER